MSETPDNVISFGSRKPLAVEQAETEATVKVAEEAAAGLVTSHREVCLEMLEAARKLIEAGKLEGLVIMGRNPESRHFYSDIALDDRIIPRQDVAAYVGNLEAMKMELLDNVAMAPYMDMDGQVVDPFEQEYPQEEEFE